VRQNAQNAGHPYGLVDRYIQSGSIRDVAPYFVALAIVTVRFIPADWPYLTSRWFRPMILCGQHSLEIFCLDFPLLPGAIYHQ